MMMMMIMIIMIVMIKRISTLEHPPSTIQINKKHGNNNNNDNGPKHPHKKQVYTYTSIHTPQNISTQIISCIPNIHP